ncbi:MAG: type II toxin-antitoxin system RelE/ParE family toxin [Methylobacter sp.]|nr:type II toxin-antitoxin system RelE/ParE family toxin [Methylobacter sp.]
MKVHVLRSAVNYLAKARKFYDRQEAGIGDYFFDSFFSEIDSLVLFGGIHSVHFGFHRLLAKRFPYAIYYKVRNGEAIVFRVLDCRHDPNRLRVIFEAIK